MTQSETFTKVIQRHSKPSTRAPLTPSIAHDRQAYHNVQEKLLSHRPKHGIKRIPFSHSRAVKPIFADHSFQQAFTLQAKFLIICFPRPVPTSLRARIQCQSYYKGSNMRFFMIYWDGTVRSTWDWICVRVINIEQHETIQSGNLVTWRHEWPGYYIRLSRSAWRTPPHQSSLLKSKTRQKCTTWKYGYISSVKNNF